jgi:hypothetical protein
MTDPWWIFLLSTMVAVGLTSTLRSKLEEIRSLLEDKFEDDDEC